MSLLKEVRMMVKSVGRMIVKRQKNLLRMDHVLNVLISLKKVKMANLVFHKLVKMIGLYLQQVNVLNVRSMKELKIAAKGVVLIDVLKVKSWYLMELVEIVLVININIVME